MSFTVSVDKHDYSYPHRLHRHSAVCTSHMHTLARRSSCSSCFSLSTLSLSEATIVSCISCSRDSICSRRINLDIGRKGGESVLCTGRGEHTHKYAHSQTSIILCCSWKWGMTVRVHKDQGKYKLLLVPFLSRQSLSITSSMLLTYNKVLLYFLTWRNELDTTPFYFWIEEWWLYCTCTCIYTKLLYIL